jgi:peptide/nickel transport system ATP-binding protein
MLATLLRVENLCVHFPQSNEPAIREVSFDLKRGQKTALLGESGCGKSLTALALLRLLPPHFRATGRAWLGEELDLLQLSEDEIRALRGRRIVLIPQGGMTYLNPVFTIGYQIDEALRRVGVVAPRARRAKMLELMAKVGLPDPPRLARLYPHELSGGMAQRVLLAAGMAGQPDLVLADEPTRGLDEDVKISYIAVLKDVYRDAAVLLITHDFQVAATCESLIVMYAGEIVEAGPTAIVLSHPVHPYTRGLLASLPQNGLWPIPGQPPSMLHPPAGCRFHPRCTMAAEVCSQFTPSLVVRDGVARRCFFA